MGLTMEVETPTKRYPLLKCSRCGSTAEASCGCGVAYLPAGEAAAKAIEAHPEKSDNAIAEMIGVDQTTVSRIRKTVKGKALTGKRIGKDGKAYPAIKRRPKLVISNTTDANTFHREAVKFLDDYERRFITWYEACPSINKDGKSSLLEAFSLVTDRFAKLAQKLQGD